MTSALREALRDRARLWGGWITGPTMAGPDGFCRAGYDYVGFDAQHSYLDDADIAVLLRGVAHLPLATAVRLPSADPAPIGRVLDAGADAVIVAMIESAEQAAAVVTATRFAPQGTRSFGPLRADLGRDITALQARAEVFVMIETAAALADIDRICGVAGLTGVYVGPADLAVSMGVAVDEATTDPELRTALSDIHRVATAAGLITGIHAGSGAIGRDLAGLGYQMLTLAAESQAMHRGAAEHLFEARGDR